jgi:hypothetical protein
MVSWKHDLNKNCIAMQTQIAMLTLIINKLG